MDIGQAVSDVATNRYYHYSHFTHEETLLSRVKKLV
jgi:hypothetical protein